MSYQERRENGFVKTTRAFLSAALILAASACGLTPPPEASKGGTNRTANSEPSPLSTSVPLIEGPLDQAVLNKIRGSIVNVNRLIKPGYERYRFEVGRCNGFIVSDTGGKPLVVTAKHCYPDQVRSQAEGKNFPAITEGGVNVLNIRVKDTFGKVFDAQPYNYYMGDSGIHLPDVILFQVSDPKFSLPPLSLNLETSSRWTTLHRVSFDNNKVSTHSFQFLERSATQGLKFFSVAYPDLACYKGTSGSPVVNNKGEVVGVLTAGELKDINEDVLKGLRLASGYRNKKYADCRAEDSDKIKGLIRTP